MRVQRANRWRQTPLFSEAAPRAIELPPETVRRVVVALADLLLGEADAFGGERKGRDDAEDQS